MALGTSKIGSPYPKPDFRDRQQDHLYSQLLDRRIDSRIIANRGAVPFVTSPGSGTATMLTSPGNIDWVMATFSQSNAGGVTTTITVAHDLNRQPVGFMPFGNMTSTVAISSVQTNEWNSTIAYFAVNETSTSTSPTYQVILL